MSEKEVMGRIEALEGQIEDLENVVRTLAERALRDKPNDPLTDALRRAYIEPLEKTKG